MCNWKHHVPSCVAQMYNARIKSVKSVVYSYHEHIEERHSTLNWKKWTISNQQQRKAAEFHDWIIPSFCNKRQGLVHSFKLEGICEQQCLEHHFIEHKDSSISFTYGNGCTNNAANVNMGVVDILLTTQNGDI